MFVSIDNPFLTFDDTATDAVTERSDLQEYVHQFAVHADLEHRFEILLFGARLARNKHEALTRYETEITEPEKDLINGEKDKASGFWKQAKFFKATILVASLGGMIQVFIIHMQMFVCAN
jgi:hypothetical protein